MVKTIYSSSYGRPDHCCCCCERLTGKRVFDNTGLAPTISGREISSTTLCPSPSFPTLSESPLVAPFTFSLPLFPSCIFSLFPPSSNSVSFSPPPLLPDSILNRGTHLVLVYCQCISFLPLHSFPILIFVCPISFSGPFYPRPWLPVCGRGQLVLRPTYLSQLSYGFSFLLFVCRLWTFLPFSSLLLISNTNMYLLCFILVRLVHYRILLQCVPKEKLGFNSSTIARLLFHQAYKLQLPAFLLTLDLLSWQTPWLYPALW